MKKFLSILLIVLFMGGVSILIIPTLNTAFSVGTGLGLEKIQKRINLLQSKAIENKSFTLEDKKWLTHFYTTLAWGASITFVLPESSNLMYHYLDKTGTMISINKSLFINSPRVNKQMKSLRNEIINDCKLGNKYKSPSFDMAHMTPIDAHFALYFGTISVERLTVHSVEWTVNMPWKWPTYKDIKKTYGTYYEEIFPLPNILSLLGLGNSLWVPNALGGELENLGLAKSFDTITTWEEKLTCN